MSDTERCSTQGCKTDEPPEHCGRCGKPFCYRHLWWGTPEGDLCQRCLKQWFAESPTP